ncbi:ATP-binding protein [Paenibacillus turicensis]|nr:ATP-binding protein [Paenibacillus turicensis]
MSLFSLTILTLNIVFNYFSTREDLHKESEENLMLMAKQIAVSIEQSRSVYEYILNDSRDKISQDVIDELFKKASPTNIINELIKSDKNLLEISVIKAYSWETTPQILFGTYNFKDVEEDYSSSQQVMKTGKSTLKNTYINDKHVLVSYVPINLSQSSPFVIKIISDYNSISSRITTIIYSQIWISIVLLQAVIFTSYILAGRLIRPIQNILIKVNQLACGDFDTRLQVKSKDEFGLLAHRINVMAYSLGTNTMELKNKNEENRAVKEYLESIISQTADAIHLTDTTGKIIRVNSAFETLYGWQSDEVVGTYLDLVPDELKSESYTWQKEEVSGEPKPLVLSETIRLRKDGSTVNVSISESPIYNEVGDVTGFIHISRDMTEHIRMEELLRRSEKLTTVGQLAAGVAHEIRNPLTTLRGFLQIQQKTQSINKLHTDIMLSELDRINLIVSEFLILAKPQAVHFQVRDVRFSIGDVLSFLDSEAHLHNIEFKVHFSSCPVLVHCEENQLKQVFINVIKNAMEAMPSGGMIEVSLDGDGDDCAIIQISDQGIGISKENLQKIGEPFYTNKEKGTGLGVMVSQRIIEAHKGTMDITSEVGRGTTVTVTLPKVLDCESTVEEEKTS